LRAIKHTPHEEQRSIAIKPLFQKRNSAIGPFRLSAAFLLSLCTLYLSAAPLSDAEIAEMLDAHNAVRRRVAEAESQRLGGTVIIPDLTWDPALAAIAQGWADSLITSNPPTGGHRKKEELQRLGLGENWYLEWSEGKANQSANAAVESWAEEEKWYDYDENTCAPDKDCRHYTQLVWSSTRRLGAGRAVRTTNDGRTYVIWVCNYAPPGNAKGEKPYNVTHSGGQRMESPEPVRSSATPPAK
jgi:pathogenesis-related protein 1